MSATVARDIASANCSSPWSQTFSYDIFGNLSKSGTQSFQPTYPYLTNHMTQIGSSTPTYDANGNVTNDFLHTYAWDAAGRPVTIDGVGVTYDASGRMVEQNKGGTYSEIVYTPSGAKLALLSGQTLTKAFVPLTGGSTAVYNSSGLAYYRHSDWIGTSRFASTPSRALYYDGAYAPFGEAYAQSGTADLSFTGMNQDTVANLYDFPAREYGTQGRWPSPDPAGIASVHIKDPQSWNRYAYVGNNPLAVTDATGMEYIYNPDGDFGGGGGCDPSDPFCGGGGCDLFCQASNGLSDWMAGGIAPDPSQMGPTLTGQSEFDALENPCSGECRHTSIISTGFDPAVGDPCVYLNNAGTGIESIDTNSSPGECGSTGGTWVQPGLGITGVGPNGNVTTTGSPFLSKVCSALPFAGVFNGLAAGGVASIYLGGGTTTLGLGAEVLTAGAISPAAPIFVGVFGVVAAATIACRASGY